MAVTAQSDRDLTFPATMLVRMAARSGSPVAGTPRSPVHSGTFALEHHDLVSGWHHHDLHQLEYALRGSVEVETRTGRHLLPPQQAVWIPAGLDHSTTIRRVSTVSVFFAPELVPDAGDRARILAAAPVIREMIVYGQRWPIGRAGVDPRADVYFAALAGLVGEWLEHETPLRLPTSADPVVAAAMAYTSAHLAGVTVGEVAHAVGTSERSLRRAFAAEAGMSWRRYLLECRLMRAMAELSEPGPTVLDVATAVGFDSVSAFTRSFRAYVGETPSGYRRRVLTG